ncbi:MAG: glycosyltransferase [Clostridia bacterium]|nr:glycosyltransferase [Clostridia bacterium]
MKLISFAVPCYNSAAYMRKCIDSILTAGDEIEIIIVNDGSKDDTLSIANEYLAQYPEIVKVVDKENGGHGSGVNAGLKLATGLYYKVVDSDDWLDEDALQKLMAKIREHQAADTLPDLYVTNFVYEKVYDNTRHVSEYTDKFPQDVICNWDKVKAFKYSHMMMMHALLYKREKLIESGLELPEHTFYVDEIYAYQPLPYMKTICYLNLDLYRYFIGRSDQSINRSNFIKRYDQQIRVMLCLTGAYKWSEIKKMPKGLKKYMWHTLNAIMITTVYFICAEYSKDRKQKLKEMWKKIKAQDRALYKKLRHRSYSTAVNYMPWRLRSWVMNLAYDRLCKTVKLG